MINFLDTPTSPNFAGRPLPFRVEGTNHIIAAGAPVIFDLVYSGDTNPGYLLGFADPQNPSSSVIFTFTGAPLADDEYELSAAQSAAFNMAELRLYTLIRESWTLSLPNANTIRFTSKADGIATYPIPEVLGSALAIANFSAGIGTQYHDSYHVSGYVMYGTIDVPVAVDVDNTGVGTIDISPISQGQYQPAFPLIASANIIAVDAIRDITLSLAENIDGSTFRAKSSTISLLPGKKEANAANYFGVLWLSDSIAYSYLSSEDNMWLHHIANTAGDYLLRFTIMEEESQPETVIDSAILAVASVPQALLCRIGPADISFGELVVYSYTVQLLCNGVPVSPVQQIVLTDESVYRTQFAFRNAFGVWELIHFDGGRSRNLKVDATISRKLRTEARAVHSAQDEFVINTGSLHIDQLPVLMQFYESEEIYELVAEAWVPVVITGDNFSLISEDEMYNESSFTYIYADIR